MSDFVIVRHLRSEDVQNIEIMRQNDFKLKDYYLTAVRVKSTKINMDEFVYGDKKAVDEYVRQENLRQKYANRTIR